MTTENNALVESLGRLADCKTLSDVLATAIDFEAQVLSFYEKLRPRVDDDCGPLVDSLATETREMHAALIRMSQDRDLAAQLEHCVARPASCDAFEHFAYPPVVSDGALDDEILQYALDLERLAFQHYSNLFDETPNGPVRDLFARLGREKMQRLETLEARWTRLYTCIPL